MLRPKRKLTRTEPLQTQPVRSIKAVSPPPDISPAANTTSDPHYVVGTSHAASRTSGSLGVRTGRAPLPEPFSWYGDEVHGVAPRFMADRPSTLAEVFFDFAVDASTEGIWGSGVHLGDGFVLTAFHVVRHILREGDHGESTFLGDGKKPWNDRWQVKAMPPRGGYGLDSAGFVDATEDGDFNDFTIVRAPEKQGQRAVAGIRASADLAPGEPLFIVGDATNEQIRVERSELAGDQSGALPGTAEIASCDLEEGFSGSPVLDANGYLVGVVFGTDDVSSSMVRSETILPLIQAAEDALGLPALKTLGFS